MADLSRVVDWQAHKDQQQAKRAENREKSTDALTAAGIFFTAHNIGAHLIVQDQFDFWPGTGLWKERHAPYRSGRGVHNLINLLKDLA